MSDSKVETPCPSCGSHTRNRTVNNFACLDSWHGDPRLKVSEAYLSELRKQLTVTRFDEFDDAVHPFRVWWEKHGQYMMAGGGRRESIWAARGWIAREQLMCGKEVTGYSMRGYGENSVGLYR